MSSDQISAWRQARQSATSEFELSVLADSVVTKAEYSEAFHRFLTCVANGGYKVKAEWQGAMLVYTQILPADSPEVKDTSRFDALTDKCSQGTTAIIEPLYGLMVTDPSGIGYPASLASCLVRVGLAPVSYSADDVRSELMGTPGMHKSFDTSDPRLTQCLQDPANTGR